MTTSSDGQRSRSDVAALKRNEQLRVLSETLSRVATAIDTRQVYLIPRQLSDAQELCEWIQPHQPQAAQAMLADLAHRLQVWRNSWIHLKNDTGFHIAVSRELHLWSQQLLTSITRKTQRPSVEL